MMNAFMMVQFFVMIGFYLVAGVLLIVLMVKGIQALSTYTQKAKLEIEQLQQAKSAVCKPCCEEKVQTEEVLEETTTEEPVEEVRE